MDAKSWLSILRCVVPVLLPVMVYACVAPLPALEGLPCKGNEACGVGLVCHNGACRTTCAQGSDCKGTARRCQEQVCIPTDVPPEPIVEQDAGVPDGSGETSPDIPRVPPVERVPDASEMTPTDDAMPPEVPLSDGGCSGNPPNCYTGPPGTKDKGPCKAGVAKCVAGKWSCEGEVTPVDEVCDGKDNDCNGKIDDGLGTFIVPTNTPCMSSGSEKGECRKGRVYCDNGTSKCALNKAIPEPKTCNGRDDNCDGQIDEGIQNNCVKTFAGPNPAFFDGVGDWLLYKPLDITFDKATGHFLITEGVGNRIRRYDPKTNTMTTVAGNGFAGAVTGPPEQSQLFVPSGLVLDGPRRLLYFSDTSNHRIRKLDLKTWIVSDVVGKAKGYVNLDAKGSPSAAAFNQPDGLQLMSDGSLLIADNLNDAIRKFSPDGSVTTLLGRSPTNAPTSDHVDDVPSRARFDNPIDLLLLGGSPQRTLIAEIGNHTVRSYVAGGRVTTLAGAPPGTDRSMRSGTKDGNGTDARLRFPYRITVNQWPTSAQKGHVYVSCLNGTIRRIVPAKQNEVRTLVGRVGSVNPIIAVKENIGNPTGIFSSGPDELTFVSFDGILRRITWSTIPPTLQKIGGQGLHGFADKPKQEARFRGPRGLAFGSGAVNPDALYVADSLNHRIRVIQRDGKVSTLVGTGTKGYVDGDVTTAQLRTPGALFFKSDTVELYFTEDEGTIRRYSLNTGKTETLVGSNGTCAWTSVSGAPQNCVEQGGGLLHAGAEGIAVAANGDIYIADTKQHRILYLNMAGVGNQWSVKLVAGLKGVAGSTNGKRDKALFDQPSGIAVRNCSVLKKTCDVYVADTGNHCIRKIDQDGNVTTFAGRCGARSWSDGASANARFWFPAGLSMSAASSSQWSLWVVDRHYKLIRRINEKGDVTTVSGSFDGAALTGADGYANGPLKSSLFGVLSYVVAGRSGELFVSDIGNQAIRQVLLP